MQSEINSQSILKIQALAVHDHELFDAMMDISYALHLLENGAEHLRKRYGVSCGELVQSANPIELLTRDELIYNVFVQLAGLG